MDILTLKRLRRQIKPETFLWIKNGYPNPVPFQVKLNTLLRHAIPNGDWIETGTYLAETTIALAKKFPINKIYTIEPADHIYQFVSRRFAKYPNIEFVHGASEHVFSETLQKVRGSVNLWLDGHYSGDITYQGSIDTPILTELDLLCENQDKFNSMRIFVDDFRLFGVAPGYPPKETLLTWAAKQGFNWTVENDIFCCGHKML
jgi:hypothetical protein